MKETKKAKALKVVKEALKLKRDIKETDSMHTIAEWDSLGHLVVLTALDKEFKGKIAEIKDIAAADSVKKILTILGREKII